MAKLGGFIRKFNGSIGNVTFKTLNGQTVASEKIEPKSVPTRTLAQMVRRVQWANLVNLYRAFEGNLHPSFENRDQRVSDFNEFMSANLGGVPVYLTKAEARQGGAVVAEYQVTRGSIPSIFVSDGTGDVKVTDIDLGGSFNITATTTVKQFTDVLLANNPDWRNGDQLTCFIATQTVNATTGVPYIRIKAHEVTLDMGDDVTYLRSLMDADSCSVVDGLLGAGRQIDGGICWVHSRRVGTGTKVSTQRFEVTNSQLAQFQTAAKRSEAIDSYGGVNKDEYLTPNNDDTLASV